MAKIKAVIFDMDGVLVEAKDWHYEALNRALNLYGFNISRQDHLQTFDGLPTRVKLEMLSRSSRLPENLHPIINKLKQIYTLDLVEVFCNPTDAHLDALRQLKANGYKLAVASNSVRQSVEVMMEKTKLAPFLDVMLSNEDVDSPKPAPDIYIAAAEKLGFHPSECLVLEDNINGIKAALAAGTKLLKVKDINEVNYANILDHINHYSKNDISD